MTFWYRDAPSNSGDNSWVVGNNGNQGQKEYDATTIMQDKIFFSALLTAPAEVQIKVGDHVVHSYDGKQGFNHWSQDFNEELGVPNFSVVRDGKTIYSEAGREIAAGTRVASGKTNYNAWVGSF